MVGVGGYIAPRHLRAIKETGNTLVGAFDPYDSVGLLDSYFPDTFFFTEYEIFDRFCYKRKLEGRPADWLSICTPNYTHDAYIRFGLRLGCNVICEKPVVLNPYNIEALEQIEAMSGRRVYNVLQLRLHPAVAALRQKVAEGPADKVYDVDLTYITSRGRWYYSSWKGDIHKSGGVATNIGVHFYDMLQWVFGPVQENVVHVMSFDRVAGYLGLKRARVRYFLSINDECLPPDIKAAGKRTYRCLSIDGENFDFSDGFTDLHTESYRRILSNEGFGLQEAYPCIKIVSQIRNATPVGLKGDYHPLARLPLAPHPFGWKDQR